MLEGMVLSIYDSKISTPPPKGIGGIRMLTLIRKAGQAIHIGDDVVIYVEAVTKDEITIGIKAPDHIEVYEAEALHETPPLSKVDHLP